MRANSALCPILLALVLLPAQVIADEASFLRYMEYSAQLREMGNAFNQHWKRGEALISERQQTIKQLAKTDQEIKLLSTARDWQMYLLFETELRRAAMGFEAEQFIDNLNANRESIGRRAGSLSARNVMLQLANARVESDVLEHQIRVANAAGELTLETRIRTVQSLQQTVAEMQQWSKDNQEMLQRYLDLADVVGLRCDIELRAGLRVLDDIQLNPGARFTRAIILLRLDEVDESLAELKVLENVPALRAICFAAQAEINFSRSQFKEANRQLQTAQSLAKNDARVRMHIAMALQAAGEFEKAEKAWQRVLEIGSQEIQARTAIARLAALHPNLNPKRKMIASENAELACKLSAGETWNCELALAVAESVNGNQQKAIEAAERATELALGSKRLLCQDVRDAIATKMSIPWGF